MTISMIWSCRLVLPSQNRDAHLFHVEKKTPMFKIFNLMLLVIFWFWAQGPWGPWGRPFLDIF